MPSSDTKIVTEIEMASLVRELTREASIVRVAVGYCGEAAYRFFPESVADWPDEFLVLVDASNVAVSYGLTNPEGLRQLKGLGARVRSLPGLHAKVLTFDSSTGIVGSTNLSDSSVTRQRQCGLVVRGPRVVGELISWFESLWSEARQDVDDVTLEQLARLWSKSRTSVVGAKTRKTQNLPKWRSGPPDAPLPPTAFEVGISRGALQATLRRFRSTQCSYPDADGWTCAEVANWNANRYAEKAKELRALYRRRTSWTRQHGLPELFNLAHLNGRAAKIGQPRFLRASPRRVAASIEYLLEGPGDPFVRFEKMQTSPELRLPGVGKAGLSMLLHLWNPDEFAILNEPVLEGLTKLGVRAGRHRAHRVGARYRDQCAAMKHVAAACRLKSLAHADHFFEGLGKAHFEVAQ